ncbi:glutamyl aminopeptidase isoform X2 [Phyllopteryx taeniolatus]|uniref:glutamyl aminopeptidase isoform X2 n=1 Tax=Phyllopteryx taeniolatus TaxID=161469 RepID=UPI002AD55E13|nr:glutamyl aminopeptidase isoform X2 [Phyllopteryx taeniolatus]
MAIMVNSMDLEHEKRQYCIRGKHVFIICIIVVVCSLAVGLGVGLSRTDTTTTTTQSTPAPTTVPTLPPIPGRGPCKPSTDSSGDWKNFRLPDYVKPVHYDLLLEPDLVDDTYTGTVEIQVQVSKPTRHLWLHIRETFVSDKPRLKLLGRQGEQKDVSVKSCFEYQPQEYVVVEATEELPVTGPGEVYLLRLDFQGWLNGSLVGFYRVVYTETGVTKKIAATDHEPTDARKSFPCFDEPNKKATYKISIIHDASYGALSNMPPESAPELLSGNKMRTSFQKSIPMSTYLVCFAVHQFDHVERLSARGIPLRIYTQPSQIETATYAANTTKIIFDYFEEYFNMNYSIPKLDKIAIPDFGTGAMENWGLITYRETNLLYDEKQSSSYNKQRVASVIAHELVHQGASILRMLEDWMGKDVFRDGCQKYLKDYYFKNAKTNNFWASLENVSGFPIGEVMDTWTKQMGYPVVELTVTETNAILNQNRFLLDPNADANQPPSLFGYKWTIPIKSHSVKSNKNMSVLFDKSSTEHVLSNYSFSVDGLLKINNDHIGFYRVNHDDQMWNAISQQLQNDYLEFDAADRTSYIDDVFALARADVIDYGHAFNLTMYLKNEPHYIVWDHVASSIAYVRDMLSGNTALYPKFQKLFRDHVKAISSELGWNDVGTQTQTERLLRETVLSIACQMEDQITLNEASDIFDQWINGSISNVAVNLRLLVYRYGMKNSGTEAKWNIMFQRYKNTFLAQEKDKLLYGLASVQDVNLLWRLLEASKDKNVVRTQDLFALVRYVSYNPMGQTMAWDWTTLNWEYLVNRYTINDRNLGRLLSQISTSYNTELQLWKMEHFFSLNPIAGAGKMPRQQALERVRNNIKWIQMNENEIRVWLESNIA